MITKNNLEQAAEKNIISPEQVEPLFQFLTQQSSDLVADSYDELREEPLKFIRSFGDIFLTLGIVLLVISISLSSISGMYYIFPVIGFILIAEWLVRIRRLALPGMAILVAILYFVQKMMMFETEHATFLMFAVLALTSFLFYFRYKMPFSLLPFAASLVSMIIMQIGFDVMQYPVVFAAMGLFVFAFAFWFDSRDTRRISHLSDNAFWLYLLASPLIVHGVMVSILLSDQVWIASISKEVLMIVFFALFFILALFLDRRAMLISTQLYIIYSLTQLFKGTLTNAQDVIMYVLVGLGLFVLYFGAYWYKTRRFIFSGLAGKAICRYVPDLNIQDIKK